MEAELERAMSDEDQRPLEMIEREITELAAHVNAATCRWLLLVAEFDHRMGWATWGAKSCAHWLNWRCGISLGTGRDQVRVAHALEGLPGIRAAFAAGTISYSKVRALVRVATSETEAELLETAQYLSASQLERVVRSMRRVLDAEGVSSAELARRQRARRRLRWHWDEDGSLVFSGRLAPEDGAAFVKALRASRTETDRIETEDVGAGDVSAEIEMSEAWEQRDADGLVALAESYLEHGAARRAGSEAVQVVVHVHAGTESTRESTIEDGPALPAETAERLACDADVVEVREDAAGTPLDVGRRTRRVSAALRRALALRDEACRFPGCNSTRVEAHHRRHWLDGGPTALGNLVSLCRYHHRFVHSNHWTVEVRGDGRFVFLDRAGCAYPETLPWTGSEVDLRRTNARIGLDIDGGSVAAQWDGTRLDFGYVVDVLSQFACRERERERSAMWKPAGSEKQLSGGFAADVLGQALTL